MRVVLDNGAGSIKAGTPDAPSPPIVWPNCIARIPKEHRRLVADETTDPRFTKSDMVYSRPHQRGYMVDPEIQEEIWERLFSKTGVGAPGSECEVLVTEPPFAVPAIRRQTLESLFEGAGVAAAALAAAPALAALDHLATRFGRANALDRAATVPVLVVDAGFSFGHAVPVVGGVAQQTWTRRVNVGGKLLTNLLKEVLSYRAFDLMSETHLVNDIKEAACFVSQRFDEDMELCKAGRKPNNPHWRDFVLPNRVDVLRGYVVDRETSGEGRAQGGGAGAGAAGGAERQMLLLNNERIAVAETLFHPTDIGIRQGGIHHAVAEACSAAGAAFAPRLAQRVVLCGGTAQLPGFQERLAKDVRPLLPEQFTVNTAAPKAPAFAAWRGGALLAKSAAAPPSLWISRAAWEEEGADRVLERCGTGSLGQWAPLPTPAMDEEEEEEEA